MHHPRQFAHGMECKDCVHVRRLSEVMIHPGRHALQGDSNRSASSICLRGHKSLSYASMQESRMQVTDIHICMRELTNGILCRWVPVCRNVDAMDRTPRCTLAWSAAFEDDGYAHMLMNGYARMLVCS